MSNDYSWFETNPDAEPAPEVDQEWQSLIASEPARKVNQQTQPKEQDEQMIQVQRSNQANTAVTPKGVQFLSPKHVTSPAGFNATIAKVTTDQPDNYGNPYVVYFSNGPEKFSKGFKSTSDLLISLVDMLGEDESKWLGKVVNINKKVDDEGGQRLVFSAPKKGKA